MHVGMKISRHPFRHPFNSLLSRTTWVS